MAKVIAICGKICAGKSYYANELKEKENAVILSCDEVTSLLFDNDLGESHDKMVARIMIYLLNKAVDITHTGSNVILDWGFWSHKDRQKIREFFQSKNILCQFHYIDIDVASWEENIKERNEKILAGRGGCDFYFDEALREKLLSRWEEPTREEIDVWHKFQR